MFWWLLMHFCPASSSWATSSSVRCCTKIGGSRVPKLRNSFGNSCMQNIRGFTVLDQKLQISLWSFHDCTLKQRFSSSASLPAKQAGKRSLRSWRSSLLLLLSFSQKFLFEKWTFAGLEKTEESYDIKNSRERTSQCFESDPKKCFRKS